MSTFKPLLAAEVDFKHLDYGNCWLSPKLDGIRALFRDGKPVSRKLLEFPSLRLREAFYNRPELEHFDGEFICGDPWDDPYSRTYSACMKEATEANVTLYAFDHFENPLDEYWKRLDRISGDLPRVVKLPYHPVSNEDDILALEQHYLDLGYEGVMLRAFQGPRSFYKFGRSTAREGTLLKLKRLVDFEARIVGFEEEMHNGNEATTDALGNTKRSSHAENKTGKGTMGKMLCEDLKTGIDFKCGIFKGFDAAWKKKVWESQEKYVGRIGKFMKLPIGEKDRPRHPRFVGWRDPIDM